VTGGLVEGAPGHADRGRGDRDAEGVEGAHREAEAGADLADPRGAGAVEDEAPSGCGAIGVCGTTVTPAPSRGSQNAVRPLRPAAGSTVATTVATDANPRFEMNIFSPVRR
jgi:hypothetical protein